MKPPGKRAAFLLVDVALAIGLLGVAVLGCLAWLLASGRSFDAAAETAAAVRLGEEIRLVLEERGWTALAVDLPSEASVLQWGADRTGARIATAPSAPGAPGGTPPPFFLIEVRRAERAGSGAPGWTASLRPVTARVSWPYARMTGTGSSAAWSEVPPRERRVRHVHLAVAR